MASLPVPSKSHVLRAGAVRLCRSWAVELGRACVLIWAPQCAACAEPEPEHWDWSVPHRWYEASR